MQIGGIRMKKEFTLSKKTALTLLIIIFSISMIFLQYARYEKNNSLFGGEPYYHLRIAEDMAKSGIPINDALLESNPKYYFNLIDYLLSFFQSKILLMILIPFFLGAISLILFYFILFEFNISEKQKFFSCILLILSPPFIYTFSSYTNYAFLVFFNMLFSFLYLKKRKTLSFLAIIPTMFISLPSILLSVVLVFFIDVFNKNNKKDSIIFSSLLLISSTVIYFMYYFSWFLQSNLFTYKNILTSTISDLGANAGISIFHVILLVIGIIVFRLKEKTSAKYISIIITFSLSAFFPLMLIFFNFFVCFLASYALFEIYYKKWEIQTLKNITLTLIIYGLLFSCFSFQTRLINASPRNNEVNGLNFLKELPEGIVLSHQSNGYLIGHFSQKKVLLDDRIHMIKGAKEKLNETNTIFYSRNLEKTRSLLSKNNISYIFIDDDMKEGLIWDKRNQGLLFLLDHSTDFERIYSKENIEIWKVVKN